ncbi:hypothetical protein ACHAXR_008883 [Thalassiosira sp. AJA248-18]
MNGKIFPVKFSYKGKSIAVDNICHQTTAAALLAEARTSFQVDDDIILRLIFKGKTIAQETMMLNDDDDDEIDKNNHPAFHEGTKIPKSGAKVIVMGSAASGIQTLNSLRSDPLMRGFEDEKKAAASPTLLSTYWGPLHGNQDKQYKFCRFQECTDASFGSRPGASTPHAFTARKLLEQLATDPGVVSILTSRELIVGTLGEMDPIDDRLMQKKQQEGACLLGYNTNHGMRIDVKLRTDDLSGFRPYDELAATLIHELSHNWVGEHNVVFWTNYGQMRVEYLWKHACLMRGSVFANGKRTAQLAGVTEMISPNNGNIVQNANTVLINSQTTMNNICQSVIAELARDMAQHHLPVQLVVPAVLTFSRELMVETNEKDDATIHDAGGQRLGGGTADSSQNDASTAAATAGSSARERALAAAENRAREARDKSG